MSTSVSRGVVSPAFGPEAVASSDPARAHAVARAAGYAAGWSQGAQAAQVTARREIELQQAQLDEVAAAERQRLASAGQALADAVTQLRATALPAVDDVAEAVLEAALRLASAVLGHEPLASSTPGRDALRRALAAGPEVLDVGVRLNPVDAATLEDGDVPDGARIVADPSLARGDAVLEHGLGRVEVLLQDAVRRAEAVLLP
jgi:flagellar assembly protein FliH